MEQDRNGRGDHREEEPPNAKVISAEERAGERVAQIINRILCQARQLDSECNLNDSQQRMRRNSLEERIDMCLIAFHKAASSFQLPNMVDVLVLEHVIEPLLVAEIERFCDDPTGHSPWPTPHHPALDP